MKERHRVVSAWWLLLAFFVGGYAGILLTALMAFTAKGEPETVGAHSGARSQRLPAGATPDSAIDWVI